MSHPASERNHASASDGGGCAPRPTPEMSRGRLRGRAHLLVVLACALAGGCDDHLMGHGQPIVNTCLRDPPLTYENFGEGAVGRHCLSCHSVHVREALRGGAPLGVDFDDWEDVLFWADRIVARAVQTDAMPPAATMRPDERVLLGEWMRCEVMPALGEVDLGGDGEGEGDGEEGP